MIRQVYDDLGGLASEFGNARPGGFDLAFDTGDGPMVVELDEEQHFNRYRATTLLRPWAADLPWTDDYLSYCRQHETEMTRSWMSGRRWTNESAPRFFGPRPRPATSPPLVRLGGGSVPFTTQSKTCCLESCSRECPSTIRSPNTP